MPTAGCGHAQVHKSENDAEEPAAAAQARRTMRPRFSHSLGSIIGVLPALEELDIRCSTRPALPLQTCSRSVTNGSKTRM